MWAPSTADEIEQAALRGELEETPSFDAKADLPAPKKNASLAVDVAAMSTDGGALLYGIAEDEHKRPTVPQPITLAGAADRVAQIVQTSIAEVPFIEQRVFECPHDPSKGYLLVVVPPSARAPHQVIVGGDLRFYGRGDKGNRILTEGEVARLYERRQRWEQDRDELLQEATEQQPYGPQTGRGLANLVAFVRPVAPDRGIWDRACATAGDQQALRALLAKAAVEHGGPNRYAPNLVGANWRRRGADEWQLSSLTQGEQDDPENARYLVRVNVNIDGRGHLFCGRAAEKYGERLLIFEALIAGNVAALLAMAGALYRSGAYHGPVDLGLAVTGLRDGYSATRQGHYSVFEDHRGFGADEYLRHDRVAAAALIEPEETVRPLVRHLFEATTGRDDFDPFAT